MTSKVVYKTWNIFYAKGKKGKQFYLIFYSLWFKCYLLLKFLSDYDKKNLATTNNLCKKCFIFKYKSYKPLYKLR